MGLLSRNNNTPRAPFFIPRFILALVIFSIASPILFQVHDLGSRTKTIVGHNLKPTPWHDFPVKDFDKEEGKLAQFSKVLHCAYLSCGIGFGSYAPQQRNHSDSNLLLLQRPQPETCPDFFKWIHRDLHPWAYSRISLTHLNAAKEFASFRVIIIGGRLYVDLYYACVQSRMMFTVWGLLQLLKRYPGMIPDVDLMFDCMDRPTVNRTGHASNPMPLFRYCTTREHFDIPFPDWSFWGWPEINIRPWDEEFKRIKRGSQSRSWSNKVPWAYWKGNPNVGSAVRQNLLRCNHTLKFGAEILEQDWGREKEEGFKKSKLSKQCEHRYKIYAEGYAWSVSLKYILSCGSVPLMISPLFEDFFSRGLLPNKHYMRVHPANVCRSINFAVRWGNTHPSQAEAIGKGAQDFMENSLSMERVYDYMFHVITEYSKLLDFTPVQPPSALEICDDSLLCFANKNERQFLERSFSSPSSSPPCQLQPPVDTRIEIGMKSKNNLMDNKKAGNSLKEVLSQDDNHTEIEIKSKNNLMENMKAGNSLQEIRSKDDNHIEMKGKKKLMENKKAGNSLKVVQPLAKNKHNKKKSVKNVHHQ